MQNRANVHNKKAPFNKFAIDKEPLKRGDEFYKMIEESPEHKIEDRLLFEISFRSNRENAKEVFAEKDLTKRYNLHRMNMFSFYEMLKVVRNAPHFTIDTTFNDKEIISIIHEARELMKNKGKVSILEKRLEKASHLLLRSGKHKLPSGSVKTKQQKAADFFFIWDCLERSIIIDSSDIENKVNNDYIKTQLFNHYGAFMGNDTYQNYRDTIKDYFSIDSEILEFKLLRIFTA